MKFAQRGSDEPLEVNLTPLIDMVFLLLLFFVVTTTFSRVAQLKIELPEADASAEQEAPAGIELSIDVQGRYYVDGKSLINTQPETLKQALTQAAAGKDAPTIVISADGKTPHQAVITAMDAARQLGFMHLSFATAETAEERTD